MSTDPSKPATADAVKVEPKKELTPEEKLAEKEAERDRQAQEEINQKGIDRPKDRPLVGHVLEQMGTHFSSKAFTAKPGQGLQMAPGESDSEDDEEIEGESQEDAKKRKEKAKAQRKKGRKDKYKNSQNQNEGDASTLFSADPNQIDLINNLNSIKLLQISEQFEMMPAESVDLDQFVKIMKECLKDTILSEREEFISELVDMFYRIVKKISINVNKEESTTIMFEDLTNYLITHEIAFDAELGTIGALNATNSGSHALEYKESNIKDPTTHNNYIEKIHYFPQIDKVILYEINNMNMRIYNGATMKHEIDVKCPGNILAVEFISDKNSICVSLSDRSFQFFDANSIMEKKNRNKFKRFPLPSTQKCLCYVQRKRVLFSAGTDGMVLAWVVDKIFEKQDGMDDPNEPVDKKKEQEKFRSYLCENTPWFLGGAATCIIDLPNIEQIATGSYKKKIELWDLKTESSKNFDMDLESSTILAGSSKTKIGKGSQKTKSIEKIQHHEEKAKEPLKRLEGHRMAIREIAYSESFKIIVSVGFDFKVMVWNPYWKDAIIKLDGHESPLVGVNCPKGLDCFITCDNKGVINVWNIKDYSCLQSFNVAGVNQVTSMRVVPKHRRLIVGSRIFKVYEYKQPFIPTTSNDNQILCALFSDIRFELYICGANTVMVWNARNGKPIRVFKNCFESDITCMALDKSHRKLILGSSRGEIKVFDVLSGVWIRPYLESHAEENGEISFIAYANEDQNIITAAWDKTIKIHRDDRNDQLEPKKLVMRGLRKAHSKDISCGDYSHNLGLIATGGRDNKVRIWEYEKMKFIDEITCNSNEVAIVKFLNPFQLLLSADNTGWIHIWYINGGDTSKPETHCVVSWRNNHSLDSHSPVTAVDSHYEPSTGEFYLIMGDERGMVKTQDLSIILKEYSNAPYDLKPFDITKDEDGNPNKKRNPWRFMKVTDVTLDVGNEGGDKSDDDSKKKDSNTEQPISNLKGGDIQSLYPFKAHKDIIKAIRYISATDEPLIFTAGLDKMAYIWGLEKGEKGDFYTCRGKLLQGYMMKPNYYWDFPLSKYDNSKESRRDNIDKEFEEVKRIRKNQKTYKKQAEQVAAKYGNMQSSLGFNATSLLGLDFEDFGTTGLHTKPASYKMQNKVDEKENLASTFYDDTGRGLKSLQVQKLLEKAKKVIDYQNKQEQKQLKGKMNMTGGKSSLVGAGHAMMQGTAQTKMYASQQSGKGSGFGQYTREDLMALEEEEEARQKARKIGPFAFLIDDDIDTEVLTNQQVFDDLKELEDILGQGADTNAGAVVKSKSKRK